MHYSESLIMDDKHGIFLNNPTACSDSTLISTYRDFSEPDARADIKHLSGDNKGYNLIIADIIAEPMQLAGDLWRQTIPITDSLLKQGTELNNMDV